MPQDDNEKLAKTLKKFLDPKADIFNIHRPPGHPKDDWKLINVRLTTIKAKKIVKEKLKRELTDTEKGFVEERVEAFFKSLKNY